MIKGTRAHLRANGETYVEHLRFAGTVAMLAIGAGGRQTVVTDPPWAAMAVRLVRAL